METRPYRNLYWCISWDQARVEQLGVARPQRTAVFDATDTVFAATTTVTANVTALDTS